MSTNISENVLKNFIVKTVGTSMTVDEAKKLGVEKEFQAVTEEKDEVLLDFNEIIQDADLYEQFATLYVNEKEQKAQAKDKEQEKEEQIAVKGKKGTGI